ncbi:MAG: hypothetical protein II350_07180 [Clostridia bacterium]|nr:hypothetical protein [Clostridia bacterium]
MTISIDPKGLLTLYKHGISQISPSPVGLLIVNGEVFEPVSAEVSGGIAKVDYPVGTCTVQIDKKEKYTVLTLLSAPKCDGFVFGPYTACQAESFGEILGAGWAQDGSVVCIQSLMPKVCGGAKVPCSKNETAFDLDAITDAASQTGNKITLQCSVRDLSNGGKFDYLGMKDAVIKPVSGFNGKVEGAAIALLSENSADELLDAIETLEIAEGLPHPTYNGISVKKNKAASSLYLIIDDSALSNEDRIRMAGRAGASCVYFAGVLEKWGHYTLNSAAFPKGIPDLKKQTDMAKEFGVTIGAHTLSNFIHPNDEYVSPIPHEKLLVMDETELTADISATDTEIAVANENNFSRASDLNLVRIGSELIVFSAFDAENKVLTGCSRGAYKTAASAHTKGEKAARLWDHGYKTVFPDFELQAELADSIGKLFADCGIRRMSFDGLEGCYYSGVGELGPAEFVRRVFESTGNELVCDASILSHYLWHAFAYCNWGEPWYDDLRRGGMHALRASHIPYFRRNLIPAMMGWYSIFDNRGRYEATSPENVEFMLSRMVAFDAGIAFFADGSAPRSHGKFGEYLDLARLWTDLRLNGDIPEAIREKMQNEESNWHLEATEEGWKLSELVVRTVDLDYCDRPVHAEAGVVDNHVSREVTEGLVNHSTVLWIDFPYPGTEEEPMGFRIRVGTPGCGKLIDPSFGYLSFKLTALGGDYLVYNGGTEIEHYDANYNLKAVVKGEGTKVQPSYQLLAYKTDDDPNARYTFTDIRPRAVYKIKRK